MYVEKYDGCYIIIIGGEVNIMIAFNQMGDRLKNLRESSGLKQKDIAKYLQVDQSYVSKYEKNERQLSTDLIEKLSKLFGCPVEYLLFAEFDYEPLPIVFRATNISEDDLKNIAVINTIALNLKNMDELLEKE